MLGALAATSGLAALARFASAQDASPVAGEWTYTDVLGTTVALPRTPVRIVANIVTAAALWDLGIEPVGVFDWTVSNYPDGDHIAWGSVPADKVVNVGNADGNIEPEMLLTLDPDVVAAREAYDAKIAEFQQVAAEKAELTNLFANFDTSLIYVGGPKDVSELIWLSSLGLNFANADSGMATEFWEELSSEQALLYPADLIFSDVYSVLLTAEDLAAEPVFAAMPAVAAGQVGLWNRDFPVSYAGATAFLETILESLRDAQNVTGDPTATPAA